MQDLVKRLAEGITIDTMMVDAAAHEWISRKYTTDKMRIEGVCDEVGARVVRDPVVVAVPDTEARTQLAT